MVTGEIEKNETKMCFRIIIIRGNLCHVRYFNYFSLQIMYMYYLLGWKGYIVKNPQKITVSLF